MEQPESAHHSTRNTSRSGPSRTAERVAAFRAAESMLPENQRVCYDPYAIRFTDPDRLDELTEYTDNHFPGLRNYVAARARHFDDVITLAAKTGLLQLVILGAGYTIPGRTGSANSRALCGSLRSIIPIPSR
jgi:O-methyltransferase involved in polyketide biosynthesis